MTRSSPSSTRRLIVTVAVTVQVLALAAAWALHVRNLRLVVPPLLVAQVLAPEDMVYADSDVTAQRGKRQPPIDVARALREAPGRAGEGASLFAQRCVACHGARAKGDGPTGVTLTPRPRDLTSLAGWKGGTRLSEVFTTITAGLPGTQMAGFDYLPVDQRFALAGYVVSLAPGHRDDTPATSLALDQRFRLSEGAPEPNVEPLGVAMQKLVAEAPAVPGAADAQALAGQQPRGAAVFTDVVQRGREGDAVAWLAADRTWPGQPARLRALVVGSYPANGFTVRAGLLSADDWAALERYLAARCGAAPSASREH